MVNVVPFIPKEKKKEVSILNTKEIKSLKRTIEYFYRQVVDATYRSFDERDERKIYFSEIIAISNVDPLSGVKYLSLWCELQDIKVFLDQKKGNYFVV